MEDNGSENKASEMNLEALAAINSLAAKVPGLEFDTYTFADDVSVIVPVDRLIEVLSAAKEAGYELFVDLAAVHYPGRAKCFEVVYVLRNVVDPARIRIKTQVAEDETVPSATAVWSGANWYEREAYDLFGIEFSGHPDLTRIFMPDDFKDHPLRKDFPLKGRN